MNPPSQTGRVTSTKIPVVELVKAKQKAEGWFEGSLSYQNNNPCNLRVDGDLGRYAGFGKFSTYELGVERCIRSIKWYADHGATVEGLVYGFSPPSDNPHDAIENHLSIVTQATGVGRNEKLSDAFDFMGDLLASAAGLPYVRTKPDEVKTGKWGGQCGTFAANYTGIKGKLGDTLNSKIPTDSQDYPAENSIFVVDNGTDSGHVGVVLDQYSDKCWNTTESNKYGDELITNYVICKDDDDWVWYDWNDQPLNILTFIHS